MPRTVFTVILLLCFAFLNVASAFVAEAPVSACHQGSDRPPALSATADCGATSLEDAVSQAQVDFADCCDTGCEDSACCQMHLCHGAAILNPKSVIAGALSVISRVFHVAQHAESAASYGLIKPPRA